MKIPGFYEQEDSHLLSKPLWLPNPDEVVEAIDFDPKHRELDDQPHPFHGRMQCGGCYLYYCYYEGPGQLIPVYVYAGKSHKLAYRLWKHWRYGPYITDFMDGVDRGEFRLSLTLPDGSRRLLEPDFVTRIAIWFVDDPVARTRLEHGLIYGFSPLMNRG